MKKTIYFRLLIAAFLALAVLPALFGQSQASDPNCSPANGGVTIIPTAAFFNYGNSAKMKSATRRMKLTVGQMVTQPATGDTNSNFGFWSSLLVAPQPPVVKAGQGEQADRIQITWEINPLGSYPIGGFKIYRDGIFLAQVDKNTRNYNDFNVIAGTNYTYSVRGVNNFGDGPAGTALGFQVPNGVATGWVRTLNGNPVPGALVALSPMQGYSVRFGQFDGATAVADAATGSHFLPTVINSAWSLTFWVRTESINGVASILQMDPNLDVRPTSTGITMVVGGMTLAGDFPGGSLNDWHHVALTCGAGQYRLYLDGAIVALAAGPSITTSPELAFGESAPSPGSWDGFLDELRIYHRRLTELDLLEVRSGTASSLTPDLKYYWKMDEGMGTKTFDVLRRSRIFFCGAVFSSNKDEDRAPIATSGVTNSSGYYRIEGVNYGTGTTFLAKPKKDFFKHRALQFERNEGDYALLTDFPVGPKATLELWASSGGPDGFQCLLSKAWPGNDFRLLLKPNGNTSDIYFYLTGQEHNFGPLGLGYQHLAFTLETTGNSLLVTAYKGGVLLGNHTFTGVTGDWTDPVSPWRLGARPSGMSHTDYFGGLIDEVALYNKILGADEILQHAQNSRSLQEKGLSVYFPMDEGTGENLTSAGALLLNEAGTVFGAEWTTLAPNQETMPHVFSPDTRQVTLNPSVTSVDQVDFTDRSTVSVSGFVRYPNTDCFARDVEILVNGKPYDPPVITDSTGQFIIDFEPGVTRTLTPKYKNHGFSPASVQVINVTSPIAGIVFNDTTIRKITGQIAGGLCRKSIIADSSTDCRIKVATRDECFIWEQVIADPGGNFVFDSLPPLEVTIAITKHNVMRIYDDFQFQGGREIDLTQKDSIGVDFLYIAPPTVGVEGFDMHYTTCKDPDNPLQPLPDDDGNPLVRLEQDNPVRLDILVYEQYGQGQDPAERCLLDSALLSIDNTFDKAYDFLEPKQDTMRNMKYDYDFFAANPNPDPPYLQIMQITADVNGKTGTFIRRALITGVIKGEKRFTTVTPMMPNFVLRDPPGDGSYAYLEKGETICNTMKTTNSGGAGVFFTLDGAVGTGLDITIPFSGGYMTEVIGGVTSSLDARFIKTSTTSMDFCLTATERISTDDGDLVVGGKTSFDGGKTVIGGNDVYVGTAFNFIISESKYLTFDEMACSVKLDVVTSAEPDSFATTYMYSEWNIENNVIRYLDSLILDGQDGPDSIFTRSKARWLAFIEMNDETKRKAKFKRNISWDAGVQYEFSEMRDTTEQVDSETIEKFEGSLGAWLFAESEIPSFSFVSDLKVGANFEGTFTQATGEFTSRGTTVGYVLKDDDPADNWTMNVKDDPLFRTPVFEVVAGQTSCPWEVGTAHREGVKLTSVVGNERYHVQSNEAASFKFLLANNSQSGETFTYALTTGPESNPHGAKIFLNGAPLDHYVYYAIPWGTTIPVTVTVERGPTEYKYDLFELVLLSECHDRRCNTLGFLPDLEPYLYSAVYLTVHFEEPCSEVDISFPQNGWVVKPDPQNATIQDILDITIGGYDKNDADLIGIRPQYRREGGDGAWFNMIGANMGIIPKAELGEVFEVYKWNTGGFPPLSDGPYEIRAITVCGGGPESNPGISHIIKGKIERTPPTLLGTPEPSDGVYQVGDEISFTFDKDINCNNINPVDDALLFNTTTGKTIKVDITCKDNKIILNPRFDNNEFIENKILRAELHDIEDLVGNKSTAFIWEFYVDRNELAWLTDSLGITKFENESKTGIANIHNRGGYPVPFTILNAPDWVHVTPNQGTLAPNEIRPVSFTIDPNLAFGHWTDSIVLHTETNPNPFFMGGDEGLPLGVRVVCHPPYGTVNLAQFENTMGMVLKVDIDSVFSADAEDIVAAFIDDELRGLANVQYVPQVNAWLAYLNVHGDPSDILKPVRIEVWDASACQRYGSVKEPFTFQPDNVIGIPNNPQVVHTAGLLLREVPVGYGWNWLSFNLAFPDNSLNAALASLKHPANDLMKSQTAFSQYSGGWIGSLTSLNNTTMYVYRADVADTLRMQGTSIDPLTTNIPLVAGWNWIGYIPDYALPINDALSSLPAQLGDIAKSQYAFAQYINPAFGWVGSLKYLSSPNGYQVKLANPGTLTYPPPPSPFGGKNPVQARGEAPPAAYWTVNPTQYEHSSTLIGMLRANGANATTSNMELGAFAGAEVRGSAQAIYIEPLDAHLFFLTTYANTAGELLRFKFYDDESGTVHDLTETMFFSPDLHQGSIENPVPFEWLTSGTEAGLEDARVFEVQPNPFSRETTLRFVLPKAEEVTLSITDAQGREVVRRKISAHAGPNTTIWNGRSDAGSWLSSGVYLVRLQTEAGSVSRKVVLQRLP